MPVLYLYVPVQILELYKVMHNITRSDFIRYSIGLVFYYILCALRIMNIKNFCR